MAAILYYTVYPLIKMVSHLPFKWLYRLSDGLYWILNLSRYRQKVVYTNLKNSFPHKSESEIQRLKENFFRYLCDLILEIVKTLSITNVEAMQHCTFVKKDWLEAYSATKQSIIVVMGHYGNWEWAGPSYSLNNSSTLVVVYRPLSNIYFEKMFTTMRTKFNTEIVPVMLTLRAMVSNRSRLTTTAFIADQTAAPESGYWTTFLNQDTVVYTGPEKLAKKFNYPVVFMNVQRLARGKYIVTPELLCAHPNEMKENEISQRFMDRLEEEIVKDPTYWLWSHKRWKHKKPN